MLTLGKLFPLVLAVVLGGVAVYLYSTGQLAGITSGANTGNAGALAGQGIQKAKDTGASIYAQPWFWSAVMAVAGATGLRYLWKNMNGKVRGFVIAAVAIAGTIFVTTVVKH